MGFKHSWIAVQGLEPEHALAMLGMEVAEVLERDYFPDGIGMTTLPDGWLLFLADRSADALSGKLRALADAGPAVGCDISEMLMCSEAVGFEGGKQAWRVEYDCSAGRYTLKTEGNLPPQLDAIFLEARAAQEAEGGEDAGVDCMFDVPAKLAQSICGFMLGEDGPEGCFSQLRRIGGGKTPSRPGFFARLFGRG